MVYSSQHKVCNRGRPHTEAVELSCISIKLLHILSEEQWLCSCGAQHMLHSCLLCACVHAAGNPVSCLVTLHLFALPALRKMAGHKQHLTTVVTAEVP